MAIKARNSVTVADVSDGTDGTGISSTTVEYQAGSSGTSKPTGTWSTTIPATSASAPYLWTRVTYRYSDGRSPLEVFSVGATPESIEIGGRNLVRNSGTFKDWIPEGDATFSDNICTLGNSRSWSKAEMWLGTGLRSDYEGKTGVVSFDVKSDNWSEVNNGVSGLAFQLFECSKKPTFGYKYPLIEYKKFFTYVNNKYFDFPKNINNGEWIRIVSKPIIINETLIAGDYESQDFIALYIGKAESAGTVQVRHVMVEESTKASDWTPAPEDVDSSISAVDAKFASYSTTSEMESAITVAKSEITSEVSETYSTKAELETVDGKVSTLEEWQS